MLLGGLRIEDKDVNVLLTTKSHQRQEISIIGKFIWARYGIDEVLGRRNSNFKEIFFLTLKF